MKASQRNIISIILTALIIALYIFPSFSQAISIDLKSKNHNKGKILFEISITLNENEWVPLENLTLRINESLKSCTFTIQGSPIKGCDNINITLKNNLAEYGYGNLLGYGYGHESGYGYDGYGYGETGYGYGYGYGNNPTELTYDVEWDAQADNATESDYVATLEVQTSSQEFTFASAPSLFSLALNHQPKINPIPNITSDEGQQIEFNIIAEDIDNGSLTLSASGLPENANFNASNGKFSWTPNYTQSGIYLISFTADDGILTSSEEVQITVMNKNRAPYFQIGKTSVEINQTIKITINTTAFGPNNITILNQPDGSTFEPGTGTFLWNPNNNQTGTFIVVFLITNSNSTVTLTALLNVNNFLSADDPILTINGKEGSRLEFFTSAADPDGDFLSFNTNSSFGELNSSTGLFSWTPGFNRNGIFDLLFTVNDGIETDIQLVRLNITEAGSGLMGEIQDIKTNIPGLALKIGNKTDPSLNFTGLQEVTFTEGSDSLIEFQWNFSGTDGLDLRNITIEKDYMNGSERMIIRGIELKQGTKTAYLNKTNQSMNGICILDSEISSLTGISQQCSEAGEVKVECNGQIQNGYRCSKQTNRLKIEGLLHSGISQIDYSTPAPQSFEESGNTHGASAGSSDFRWQCTEWSECMNSTQTRVCRNIGTSPGDFGKPNETQPCNYTPKPTKTISLEGINKKQNEPSFIVGPPNPETKNKPDQLTGNIVSELADPPLETSIAVLAIIAAAIYAGYLIYRRTD